MNIGREDIYIICRENNISTVDELLKYLDFQEYAELVDKESKELENSTLKFRHIDRAESLDYYKSSLYNQMISEGKILNKEDCMNYHDNWAFEYQRSEVWNKNLVI